MVVVLIFGKFRGRAQAERLAQNRGPGNRFVRGLVLLQIMLPIQFPTAVWQDNELEEVILHSCLPLYCFITSHYLIPYKLLYAEMILGTKTEIKTSNIPIGVDVTGESDHLLLPAALCTSPEGLQPRHCELPRFLQCVVVIFAKTENPSPSAESIPRGRDSAASARFHGRSAPAALRRGYRGSLREQRLRHRGHTEPQHREGLPALLILLASRFETPVRHRRLRPRGRTGQPRSWLPAPPALPRAGPAGRCRRPPGAAPA